MQRPAVLAAALIVLLGTATRAGAPMVRSAAQSQLLTAQDVSQPEGWDADLTLPQPTDLNPDPRIVEINLEAKIGSSRSRRASRRPCGPITGCYPGHTSARRSGQTVIVHFKNSLPEETTIHWHGVRVPNSMDGAPGLTQPPIAPGGEFRYEFVVKDAGTYWYHPHLSSSAQVGWGLYGPIVVEDPPIQPIR